MKRILVVDDDPAIGRMLSIILQQEGHKVVAVTTAEAALEHLRANRVDVVLSELFLGSSLNGLYLCSTVRREWPRTRCFIGTRSAGLDAAVAEACQVEAVLLKPYHLVDVRRIAGGAPIHPIKRSLPAIVSPTAADSLRAVPALHTLLHGRLP